MTTAIPTSGTARRRSKAIARRRHVHAQENDRLVAAGGLPHYWAALDACPCGRVSWLEDGASDEEFDAFYLATEDHAAYCPSGLGCDA